MAIVRFVDSVKNSVLTPLKGAIDAGSGGGTIKIYSGTQPTLASDAVTTQNLLGILTFSQPCGVVASGALTMSTIVPEDSALYTGTATWARIADSAGNTVMDVNVSVTGGGGALQLNTTSIVSGGPILISNFVISVP